MAYNELTLQDVKERLGVTVHGMRGDTAEIELTAYYLADIPKLVGILLKMVLGQA